MYTLSLLVILLVYTTSIYTQQELRCSPGIETPGATYPRGDIPLLYGDSLRITCLLDPARTTLNSSRLHFMRGVNPVESSSETVINSTAIELYVARPPKSDIMYVCRVTPDEGPPLAVCLNRVTVGTVPEEVKDFSCISLNWENMTCSWTPPHNYLYTKYTLMYQLPGRSGRTAHYTCPDKEPVLVDGKQQCFWNLTTTPFYRQSHQNFFFNLTSSNAYGNLSRQYRISHFARVKPNRPHHLRVEQRATDSALVRWNPPNPMQDFPPGLIYAVKFQSEYDRKTRKDSCEFRNEWCDDEWRDGEAVLDGGKASPWRCRLENLRAYTWYDVRVFAKSAAVKNDSLCPDPVLERDAPCPNGTVRKETLWSDFAWVTFRTTGKRPDRPPDVQNGNFELTPHLQNRDVIVYWKQLDPSEKNDENLTYVVRLKVDGADYPLPVSETVKGHLSLSKLPLRRLDFTVASKNSHGESEKRSSFSVPDQNALVGEPVSFTKIEFGDGVYELSWKPPNHSPVRISDYTLFWCDNARDRPYQCDGRLKWEVIPASQNIRNVTVGDDRIYQFAISAGGLDSNSGMVWASCTVIPNKVVGKMKNIWINRVGARYIEVGWKLECSDRIGVVDGYRISYCPIVSPHNRDCKEPAQNVTITRDPSAIHSNVTGLKPYTTYAIRIAVVTTHGDGLLSDTLYNTTLEGPPSSPTDVRVSDVSDSRMLVSWHEPLLKNGVLRYYKVNYDAGLENLHTEKVEKEIGYTETMLRNLTGYTNYTITVEACTVECSRISDPIVLRTAIGRPGRIRKPIVHLRNNTRLASLSWDLPEVPGGTVDLFELRVVQSSAKHNTTYVYNTTQREFLVPEPVCKDEGILTYHYSVRAINFDSSVSHGAAAFIRPEAVTIVARPPGDVDTLVYYGSWSPEAVNMCLTNRESSQLIIMIVIGLFIIIVACFFVVAGKKLWLQYKEMQDIGVSLPPGLDTIPEKDPKYLFNNITGPTKHIKDQEKSLLTPSADEISLLPNRNVHLNGTKTGRDLSGFSVNTDSTTISLTSNRNSGDECKDVREPREDGNSDSTDSSNSSLRLRNINSISRPTSAASDRISWTAKKNSPDDTVIPPYSAVGATIPPNFNDSSILMMDNPSPIKSTLEPISNGYVTVANIPNIVAKETINRPTPTDSPSRYVKAALNTEPAFVPVENGDNLNPNKSGYVSVNHPMLLAKPYQLNSSSPQSLPAAVESGYVKCDDPRFNPVKNSPNVPIIDFEKKSPNISKRISAPPMLHEKQPIDDRRISADYSKIQHVNLPKGHQFNDNLDAISPEESAISPEAYCRFGWDVNKPENQFDFSHNFADISALNGGEEEIYDESLDDMMLNDQAPPSGNRQPAPHYFRLNNLPGDKQ